MSWIYKPLCLFVGWWRSLRFGGNWSGCDFVDEIENLPALVTVARCKVCGEVSISWVKQ